MRSNKTKSMCPSRYCAGSNPAQELVNQGLALLANDPAIEGAIRCSACGCVWTRNGTEGAQILGTLRKNGREHRWTPARKH